MKNKLSIILSFLFLFTITCTSRAQNNPGLDYWPQWRGPLTNGVAVKGNPPVKFGENQNLKWKTPILGKGHATPVVWGDKIIVLTAVPSGINVSKNSEIMENGNSWMEAASTDLVLDFKVILINLNDGKIIWEKTVTSEKPHERTHVLGSWASGSPITDGELIYAYFGSRGLFCLDYNGNVMWKKNFGKSDKRASFGEGESPFLYKDKIFIQWDQENESYMYALNAKTGDEIWTKKRDVKTSWSTPNVVEVNGQPQLITCASNSVRSYDINTGETIWTCAGLTENVIPNAKYADGILYVSSGFRGNSLMAIDIAKAKGDITGTNVILWSYNQDCPYTPDNLLLNGRLYFLRANNGELTCVDAKTGAVKYSKAKLEGIRELYSSPTGVGDKIYIAAENICLVIKAGDTFEILSSNTLDDNFRASPVIVGNKLLLRGFNSLYCFEE
jgi:outer membrane protein assembly factor BamB